MDAIVGLGSNLGSREAFLRVAIRLLGAHDHITVCAVSPPYVTPPLGPPQPDYLNAAVRITTELAPLALLAHLQRVEQTLGRVREVRWGPRTIDLDVLHAFEGPIDEPGLTVPHPGLRERAFALAPLLDVAPELGPELGPVLAALEAPRRSRWTELHAFDRRIEVEADDPLDALALAVDASRGALPLWEEVRTLEVPDAEALVRHLAELGGPPGWLVLEPAASGAIRARFTVDPACQGLRWTLREQVSSGSRARVVLEVL